MAVVESVSEDVRMACLALAPWIKIVTFSIFGDAENLSITHRIEVDTSITRRSIREPKTEEDHLKEHGDVEEIGRYPSFAL